MGSLFDYASFAPHGYCLLWNPWLIALHVVADLLISVSYFAIPGALFLFLRRRPELRYRGIVALFAAFILLCGLTHLVSLATLWLPVYTAEGLLKLATGLVSAATAVVLFRLVPRLVEIPSPHDLETVNGRLRAEIAAHEETLARLREAQQTLEEKVEARTRDLTLATQRLSVLSQEAVHRSRNLLTVVASIARQTVRGAPDLAGFLDSFLGRVSALSNATAALIDARGSASVAMDRLVDRQLQPVLMTFGDRVAVEGAATEVNSQAAQQISLILHELATNSQKHGVLAQDEGTVELGWRMEGTGGAERFELTWTERGGPRRADDDAVGGGFGSTLMLRIAPATLGGTAEARMDEGFVYRLRVPAAGVRPTPEGEGHDEELARSIVDEAWGPGSDQRA